MENEPREEAQKLRKFAKELRDRASEAELPGYAEQLLHAALEVEKRAAELEASF